MSEYNFRDIENKWHAIWERQGTFKTLEGAGRPKAYCLEMFPYPSGAGLHVGHLKNYVPMDAYCRFKSMNGFDILHPMGWDAFGQPAENEALRLGRNPRDMVPEYAAGYKRTLQLVGCSYDWDREINSSLPDYYRWTQWWFLKLYHKGLAYRDTAPINWCPSCKTGLANEEVKEGRCWRCDMPVEKKPMQQWFFRITAYAERLLKDLDGLHWSDGMKEMQRDWIGRSEGADVDFGVEGGGETLRVFTTRPDTLYGATFMVLAPEHPLVDRLTAPERKAEVDAYVRRAQSATEIERMNAERTKTGVFTGRYAVNPVNEARTPIWIADYVLMGYGTGAIMSVPAHDARDFEFAKKFDLPIVQVVAPAGARGADGALPELKKADPGEGIAVNSGRFNGMTTAEFKTAIARWLEEQGKGKYAVHYRLRDWLISRQRYWGAPIPIVHCAQCGTVPVPETELPVLLPSVENYAPSGTGESPLAAIPEFVNTRCPACGGKAKRETDTMGGYACSSWYFFRFADPHNDREFASREKLRHWLPVDLYAGGVEHARSHLLYARFWTKVLHDEGIVDFTEPFLTLRNQGSLLAYTPGRHPRAEEETAGEGNDDRIIDWIVLKPEERDTFPKDQVVWRWARMSKSKGNVITPNEIANKYGADSLRVYEMFAAPFEDNVQWTEERINGPHRFVSRVWRWITAALPHYEAGWKERLPGTVGPAEKKVRRKLHQAIRKVGMDIDRFQFNTAVAALMELLNEVTDRYALDKHNRLEGDFDPALVSEIVESLVLILAPFAPHMADELWERMGKTGSTYRARWPEFDPAAAAEDEITIAVQINGKLRDTVTVPADSDEEAIKAAVLARPRVVELTRGKEIARIIVVPKRLVNIAVR